MGCTPGSSWCPVWQSQPWMLRAWFLSSGQPQPCGALASGSGSTHLSVLLLLLLRLLRQSPSSMHIILGLPGSVGQGAVLWPGALRWLRTFRLPTSVCSVFDPAEAMLVWFVLRLFHMTKGRALPSLLGQAGSAARVGLPLRTTSSVFGSRGCGPWACLSLQKGLFCWKFVQRIRGILVVLAIDT